jgi:hypothetical protein
MPNGFTRTGCAFGFEQREFPSDPYWYMKVKKNRNVVLAGQNCGNYMALIDNHFAAPESLCRANPKQMQALKKQTRDVTGALKEQILALVARLALTDGRTRQGRALRAEIEALEAEYEAHQEKIKTLLDGFGRKPSELDRIVAAQIRGLEAEIAAEESAGRDCFERRKLLIQLLRGLGVKPQPAATKAGPPDINDLYEAALS